MWAFLLEDDTAMPKSIGLMPHGDDFNVLATDLGEEGLAFGKVHAACRIRLKFQLAPF